MSFWPWSKPKAETFKMHHSCADCGVLVRWDYAQEVSSTGMYWSGKVHYCLAHKKSYDSIHRGEVGVVYFRSFQVSESGVPVGYAPIKGKK